MSRVKVINNNEIIFAGNILEIPIKQASIVKMSIEVFDDDDPCIIHKSYIVKCLVDELVKFKQNDKIYLYEYQDKLSFLDIPLTSVIYYED